MMGVTTTMQKKALEDSLSQSPIAGVRSHIMTAARAIDQALVNLPKVPTDPPSLTGDRSLTMLPQEVNEASDLTQLPLKDIPTQLRVLGNEVYNQLFDPTHLEQSRHTIINIVNTLISKIQM